MSEEALKSNSSRRPLEYLLILDFEATCGQPFPRKETEIIELPTLLLNVKSRVVEAVFHEYVRPERHKNLTEFCTSLTGIKQETVDAADLFPHVWKRFKTFLRDNGVFDNLDSYAFLTCGDWDLKTMLPAQLAFFSSKYNEIPSDPQPPFTRWINIKKAFADVYKCRKPGGMADMLRQLELKLDGQHHSGIDDCKNIAKIARKMLEDGWIPTLS